MANVYGKLDVWTSSSANALEPFNENDSHSSVLEMRTTETTEVRLPILVNPTSLLSASYFKKHMHKLKSKADSEIDIEIFQFYRRISRRSLFTVNHFNEACYHLPTCIFI